MLHLYFGKKKESIRALPSIFDTNFDSTWIDNPQSKRLIKAIDRSEVIKGNVIESPVLGTIPPQMLSGTVKGLILMIYSSFMEGKWYCGECFGDNALPFMLEIARTKDIYVTLAHDFKFPKDMTDDFYDEGYGEVMHGYAGYLTAYRRWAVTTF